MPIRPFSCFRLWNLSCTSFLAGVGFPHYVILIPGTLTPVWLMSLFGLLYWALYLSFDYLGYLYSVKMT
ncbi:unnamed protein product, partial [Amoebophrya sp. A25]|eukprot:GSA25T00022117001.1